MRLSLHLFSFLFMALGTTTGFSYEAPVFPFAPAAGEVNSTAVAVDDPAIREWATTVTSVNYGEEVAEEWRIPGNALGPGGGSQSHLLVLGRGGDVVLEFASLIQDGPGNDFVVFENAFRDTFLELAFVEVSSDGQHFVRFPAYSLTPAPVPAFGEVFPTFVHGLAGKYRTGFGTPFDLDTLSRAYSAARNGVGGFSESYRTHLLQNAPHLDLAAIRFVRLVDIPGDGSVLDCEGFPIFDPYPTSITAGFDLDAVGVINSAGPRQLSFSEWCGTKGVPAEWGVDHDDDKWTTGMEYLLDSNPSSVASRPVMETRLLAGSGEFVATFDLNPLATRRPVAEISPDGKTWEEVPISRESELLVGTEVRSSPIWAIRASLNGQSLIFFRLTAEP
jgi:hypothetical protein